MTNIKNVMQPKKDAREQNDGDKKANPWLPIAVTTLIEEGIEAVKVDRLAHKLNLTRGSFYHHYKNHAELLKAMLEHFVRTNHQGLVDMLDRLQGSAKEKLWVIWTETASRDFRDYDWAVRMWGMHDAGVAAVLMKIDEQRMNVLMALFKKLGFNKDEAWIRAALAYHGSLGDRAFFASFPPMAKRLKWRKIALEILTRRP